MPRPRTKTSTALPAGWRHRHGAYSYQVPPAERPRWDGKVEFRLGKTFEEAFRTWLYRTRSPDTESNYMDALLDRYLLEVTPAKARATQKSEVRYLADLRKTTGELIVREIKPPTVYRIYNEKYLPRGTTVANKHMQLLKHVFTKSIEWGVRDDHPMTGGKFSMKPSPHKTVDISRDQVINSLQLAPSTLHCYVRLKLLTGLRQTDLLELRLEDWTKKGLKVDPSKTRRYSGNAILFTRTPELEKVIKDVLKLANPPNREYLFVTRDGRRYIHPDKSCNAFRLMWSKWMRRVEKEYGFTYSERYLRNMVGKAANSDEEATQILGHSNLRTTRTHYRDHQSIVTVKSIL